MHLIYDYQQIKEIMITIKSKKQGFLINFFLEEERCDLLIKKRLLYYSAGEKCIFIFYRDYDFYHLYYVATNIEQLNVSLRNLVCNNTENTFVSDLVGNPYSVEQISNIFLHAKFTPYTLLYRMKCFHNLDIYQELDVRVKYAELKHAKSIHELLEIYFDKYSEQIPLIEEIEQWIIHNNVLINIESKKIIGFVIFEINGVTSYLRYWFTHPEHRDQKIGSALIRRFFYECRFSKRQLFWVINTNDNAITRYKHYGFEFEQMHDQIMIKKI
jgi:ribosomal protein S18 acetylase RimI-like enzyme